MSVKLHVIMQNCQSKSMQDNIDFREINHGLKTTALAGYQNK
jgi:hypothetical protein